MQWDQVQWDHIHKRQTLEGLVWPQYSKVQTMHGDTKSVTHDTHSTLSLQGNGSSVDLSAAFGGRVLPAKPASNLLQAQTFTDVLANVASDWQNPPPQVNARKDYMLP